MTRNKEWTEDQATLGHAGLASETPVSLRRRPKGRGVSGVATRRQLYQELSDFLPDGYLITDTAGIIQEANPTAATLLRVNQDFLIGQALLDFVAGGPAARQAFRNQLARLTHLERVQDWEVTLQPREGASFPASLTVGVKHNPGGQWVGLQWLLHDITQCKQTEQELRDSIKEIDIAYQQAIISAKDLTQQIIERKQAEEAIKESQRRLQALFENAPDAILFMDDESRLMEVNPAACTLLGYSPDELLQMKVWDLMSTSNRALAHKLWQVFLAAGRQSGEFPLRHKGGRTVEVEYRAVANVRSGLHIVIFHDITERKRWTEQLTSLNKAGQTMASSLDLDQVLEQVVIETTTLVKAEGASLLLLEPERDELVFVASISPGSKRLIGSRMPATVGIAGWAMAERQSVLLNNVQADPRFYKDIDAITHLTTHSLLAIPLICRNKVIGVIEVINKLDGVFDPSDLALLQALGSSAAIAIENARLFEATRHSQERYRHLFDDSPISIWEQDFSAVKIYLDQLQAVGVKDLGAYFEQHPEEVKKCARLVKVVEVNKACLTLYQAAHKEELLTGLGTFFTQETYAAFREELTALAAGQTTYEGEAVNQTLLGDKINIWLRLSIAPSYETTWSKVLVSIIDITALKQAEAVVKKQRQELRRLSSQLINAQEAERKRLAHELHDELGQALTAIGINLEAIEHELPPSFPPSARKRLADAVSLTDQTLAQVRELSLNLRPSLLDDLGLEAALSWYVKRYAARGQVEVELDMGDFDGRPETKVEIALYRVVQEALTNVARHAQAQRIYLRLARQGSAVSILIEDDGHGFDVQSMADRQTAEPGLGLIGIRERVTALGGRFDIQSQPGRGTKLLIEIQSDC